MDTDNIMNKLNDLLKNPDSTNAIKDLVSKASPTASSQMKGGFSPESIQKISRAMSDNSDPKINLLYALKPYMSQNRAYHIDNAIKMLKMTKITGFLKDI